MVSESLVPPSRVEWMWMTMPPIGMLGASMLAFGPPPAAALALAVASAPVVVLAPVVHAVEVDGGS
jgi:hypothetical protein